MARGRRIRNPAAAAARMLLVGAAMAAFPGCTVGARVYHVAVVLG